MGFQLRTVPKEHQIVALQRALKKPKAFGYLAETGTGKTIMLLNEWQHRLNTGELTDLLVVAPSGSIQNWYIDKNEEQISEIKKHLDPKLYEDLFIVTNRKTSYWKAQRSIMLRVKRPRILFVNIESLSRGDAKHPCEAEVLCTEFLKSGKAMMVIDESTKIRATKSVRTKAIMRIRQHAVCRRIMTGLVSPKSPIDLFGQMNFLDPEIIGITSLTAFKARYTKTRIICREPEAVVDMRLRQIMNKKRIRMKTDDMPYYEKVKTILDLGGWIQHIPIIEEFLNLDELNKKIAPYCYQVLKKDCLDLEPKTYQFRHVEMNIEQKRIYRKVLEEATSELENQEHVTANNVVSQMMRLHQVVCGHVKNEEGKIEDLGNNRTNALIDILDEHGGKAIIWVYYDYEIRRLVEQLKKEYGEDAVAAFWGGNLKSRSKEEIRFLSDEECRFMVATPASGGYGNTWNVANLTVYMANSYDLEHRFQSEDRNHRYGQKDKVTYIDIMTPDTVEERIITSLRKKINLNSIITGENYREWLI